MTMPAHSVYRLSHSDARQELASVGTSTQTAVAAIAWFGVACVARGLLAVHVEGVLDHDQAVVGLMALDISEGRRFPIFFDGQRYMGAIEAYVAAVFVRFLGLSPFIVALAPLLFCGLFVAGQFIAWNEWKGRAVGHAAALITVLCSPMAAFWTMIPRGGYVEFMAWCLPVLLAYRRCCAPDRPAISSTLQFGWGLLLGLGFYINPMSAVIYTTLLLDWTFGRHGANLRARRRLDQLGLRHFLDSRWNVFGWLAALVVFVMLLTFGCHVRLYHGARFVFVWDLMDRSIARIGGLAIVGTALIGAAAWSGLLVRVFDRLTHNKAVALGLAASLTPFLAFHIRSLLGIEPAHASLPMWLRDPRDIPQNMFVAWKSLPALFGCDARALTLAYDRWPEQFPASRAPVFAQSLTTLTPVVVTMALGLILFAVYRDRQAWHRWLSLRGAEPASPTMLASLGILVAGGLFLVQATSPDGSASRYLISLWVFLPGLLATSIVSLRSWGRWVLGALVVCWTLGQTNMWIDFQREHPMKRLVQALERRGVSAILAPQHLGLIAAELSQNRVGFYEYQAYWARVHDRYISWFRSDAPIVCVAETENRGLPQEDLAVRLRKLAEAFGGTTQRIEQVGAYEIWQTTLPLERICAEGRIAQATN